MDSSITPLRHGGLSLVQTTDFFYPLVEDPYMQGKTHAQGIGTPPFDIQIPPYINIKIPETFENQTSESNTIQMVRWVYLITGPVFRYHLKTGPFCLVCRTFYRYDLNYLDTTRYVSD